jgi:DtxR family Mn-dependent transcriptional regulator
MAAKMIVRKHRLWEVFLVEKLNFNWDEVHDVAEELEHIKSEKLINKLDAFLGYPTEDPHGDPIPDSKGDMKMINKQLLSELPIKKTAICIGVKDSSSDFLQYLDKQKISLGSKIEIIEIEPFDQSYRIKINDYEITVTKKIANNLFVKTN